MTWLLLSLLFQFAACEQRLMWPQKEQWDALGQTWDNWTPCDQFEQYQRYCSPIEPQCEVTEVAKQSTKGLGNALNKFTSVAAGAFSQKCTINFERHEQDKFDITAHTAQPPNPIPGCIDENSPEPCNTHGPCVHYAITREGPTVARALALARKDTPVVPTVGLHMRTGWADAMARNKAEWAAIDCSAYEMDPDYADAEDLVIGFLTEEGRHNVTYILNHVADAADSAFGVGNWKLHVASDSPRAKQFVADYLKDRAAAVMSIVGEIGHNNHKALRYREAQELGRTAIADFIALAESDMLVHLKSKFPRHARSRALCPQRQLKMLSMERSADTRQITLSISPQVRQFNAEKDPSVYLEKFQKVFPHDHPCFKTPRLEGCFCLLKMAIGPENDRPSRWPLAAHSGHDEL